MWSTYEYLFPQLAESEDERIRKELIDFFDSALGKDLLQRKCGLNPDAVLAYLEKQKEPTKEELYAEAGTTEKEYIANTMKMVHAMQEKQKEQKLNYCHYGGDPSVERCKYCSATCSARLTEEQKPILEVFGFKVGDAVRLKDGDGRKHIIKSFEEVEGLHGPNFYHVEFEDDSARSGIYTGEEYPNGYHCGMDGQTITSPRRFRGFPKRSEGREKAGDRDNPIPHQRNSGRCTARSDPAD